MRILLISLLAFIVTGFHQANEYPVKIQAIFADSVLVRKYAQIITPGSLARHLYILASDSLEGRETGARGQKMAADYLAAQYKLLGLTPRGTSGFLQPFDLYRVFPETTTLELYVGKKKEIASTFSADRQDNLSYYFTGTPKNEEAGVVFGGYGIADDQSGYNDFAALARKGISINNKWLVILEDEPLSGNGESLTTADHKPSQWTKSFFSKRTAIWKAGQPKGVLIVKSNPNNQVKFADGSLEASQDMQGIGDLSGHEKRAIPQMYVISVEFADKILKPSGYNVERLQREIAKEVKPVVFAVSSASIKSRVRLHAKLRSENVLAFIEGSDPVLKSQVIIVTAHYDHLGRNKFLKGDQIFNGAADDGSGTTGCLEMAKAFMRAKREGHGPRRSILFINFSGEEKGLWGSFYYVNKQPLIPLERTYANINMDGIGGIDIKHPTGSKNYIYVANAEPELSSELIAIAKQVNISMGNKVEITDVNDFTSDDRSFRQQLIPSLYFSTGRTEYYHTVRDEAGTIDYDHMARVTRLIFSTIWQIANQDKNIKSPDRKNVDVEGYKCIPCTLACDTAVFKKPGECPLCGMNLAPNYIFNKKK